MSRRDDIAANLAAVEERLQRACDEASRDRDEVTLIVVTKTCPASDVAILRDLGITDVGENRHPEAGDKHAELGELAADLRWHFVGALQTNKVPAVAGYADVVHSVDRPRLVTALAKAAARRDRRLGCLVQVNLEGRDDDPAGRAGCAPHDLASLADQIAGAEQLQLRGLMAVAPLGEDPAAAFARLHALSQQLIETHPGAGDVSAGMSGDLEAAVAHGATHVRIGRSVLGARPPLR